MQNEFHYSNSGLTTLAVLARTMQLIRGLDTASWPYLCFLLRNWQLEMSVNGRDANTEEFLQYLLDDAGDSHDSDRKVTSLPTLPFHSLICIPTHLYSLFGSPSDRECSTPCPIHIPKR